VLGRFLEISLQTGDIRASVEFYERLGFTQCETGDVWPHPYGVMTDGRIAIGLHEYRFPSPSLTFVRPEISRHARDFETAGIRFAFQRLGDEVFHEIGFRDPHQHMVTVLEARTFSPSTRGRDEVSLCGDFAEYSMPSNDFAAAVRFWEPLGFVATGIEAAPYEHMPLTSDHLDLAFHARATADRPLLVFRTPDMDARIAWLASVGIAMSEELPPELSSAGHARIDTPEGATLLLSSLSD